MQPPLLSSPSKGIIIIFIITTTTIIIIVVVVIIIIIIIMNGDIVERPMSLTQIYAICNDSSVPLNSFKSSPEQNQDTEQIDVP